MNGPRHGRLTLHADGSSVYRPDRNYNGRDTFVYSVSDGKGGTDRAWVTLRVRPAPEPTRPGGDGGSGNSVASGGTSINSNSSSTNTIRWQG